VADTSGFASDVEHAQFASGSSSGRLDHLGKMAMLQWHIERYDRLRSSTANRAAVVLSAAALLSAANAVLIFQLLSGNSSRTPLFALAVCATITAISTALIIQSVVRACGVLVTGKDSRSLFATDDTLPLGLIFNGTDTVSHLRSFDEFVAHVETQSGVENCRSAQVELWIGIHQHRHRYIQLRGAVRSLRYAACFFLVAMLGVLAVGLLYRTPQ
jgi:hypothetical protein